MHWREPNQTMWLAAVGWMPQTRELSLRTLRSLPSRSGLVVMRGSGSQAEKAGNNKR